MNRRIGCLRQYTCHLSYCSGVQNDVSYVLDPTRAAIQALAPTVTGAGSKCHRTGLDTEGLPVTRTAALLCTLIATVTRLLNYYSPCR